MTTQAKQAARPASKATASKRKSQDAEGRPISEHHLRELRRKLHGKALADMPYEMFRRAYGEEQPEEPQIRAANVGFWVAMGIGALIMASLGSVYT